MGVTMKRSFITIVTALLLISLIPASSFASEKNEKKSKEKQSTTTTPVLPALKCRPTRAIGHTALRVGIPVVRIPAPSRTLTFTTNCGDIVVQTDGVAAPMTTTAMTYLAKQGYFNHTLCHRLTTAGIFVLQCGDPTATGSGGPNWQPYRDENLPTGAANDYPEGIVAMANSGPNTNGSQFFFVYADTTLPPAYTRWGTIIKGLDIVKAIAAQGVATGTQDGPPKQTVAIESVSIR
jgi:peptidyl-prolyl cis-trans isomerase B (cyclophilin B)